jgi:hypothetical protein
MWVIRENHFAGRIFVVTYNFVITYKLDADGRRFNDNRRHVGTDPPVDPADRDEQRGRSGGGG